MHPLNRLGLADKKWQVTIVQGHLNCTVLPTHCCGNCPPRCHLFAPQFQDVRQHPKKTFFKDTGGWCCLQKMGVGRSLTRLCNNLQYICLMHAPYNLPCFNCGL